MAKAKQPGGRFIFRGNAIGAAGRIDHPVPEIIPTQGVSSLPTIGGISESEVLEGKFKNLTFEVAYTLARGTSRGSVRETFVNAVVKHAKVLDVFEAQVLSGALHSRYSVGNKGRIAITPSTGDLEIDIRLFGRKVGVKLLGEEFLKLETKDQIWHWFEGSSYQFHQRYERIAAPDGCQEEYLVYSIVDEIEFEHPDVKIMGHAISVRNFGRIILGEVLRGEESSRLSMCRIELGRFPEWTIQTKSSKSSAPMTIALSLEADPIPGGSKGAMAFAEVESNGKEL